MWVWKQIYLRTGLHSVWSKYSLTSWSLTCLLALQTLTNLTRMWKYLKLFCDHYLILTNCETAFISKLVLLNGYRGSSVFRNNSYSNHFVGLKALCSLTQLIKLLQPYNHPIIRTRCWPTATSDYQMVWFFILRGIWRLGYTVLFS